MEEEGGGAAGIDEQLFCKRFFVRPHTKEENVINKMKYPFEYLIIIDTRIYDIDKKSMKKNETKKNESQYRREFNFLFY